MECTLGPESSPRTAEKKGNGNKSKRIETKRKVWKKKKKTAIVGQDTRGSGKNPYDLFVVIHHTTGLLIN